MVACLEVTEHRRGNGRHAGCGRPCVLRAFERDHPLLEHPHRGVREAAVDEARLLVLEAALGRLHRLVDIARGEEHGLAGLAEGRPSWCRRERLPSGLSVSFRRVSSCSSGYPKIKKPRPWRIGARVPTFLASCLTWPQAGRLKSPRIGAHLRRGRRSRQGWKCRTGRGGLSPAAAANYNRHMQIRAKRTPAARKARNS